MLGDTSKNREIVIGLRLELNNITQGFNQANREIQSQMNAIRSKIIDVSAVDGKVIRGYGGMFQSKRKVLKDLRKEYGELGVDLKYQTLAQNAETDSIKNSIAQQQNYIDKIKNTRKEFAGWAMSIMFFGMAMQRTFMGFWKEGQKTFQDVMSSVEGTTTGFELLSGGVKEMQFSIGAALEPLAYAFIPIVDNITDLIQRFPEFSAGAIASGIAIGTIFMVGGMGVLAINGFIELGGHIKNAITDLKAVPPAAEEMGTGLEKGSTKGLNAFNALQKAIGVGILLYVGYNMFQNATNDTPATTADWIKNLGLAAIGGYMVGGAWGALAAFAVTAVIMVAEESVKAALETADKTRQAMMDIMAGNLDNISAFDAYNLGYQGTIFSPGALASMEQQNNKLLDQINAGYLGITLDEYQKNKLYYGTELSQGRNTNTTANMNQQPILLQLDGTATRDFLAGDAIQINSTLLRN